MLTLEPFGGLGNRIRALASGLDLAEKAGHKLRVVWVQDPSIACSYGRLFRPLPGVSVKEERPSIGLLALPKTLLFRFGRRIRKIFGWRPSHDLNLGQDDMDRLLKEQADLVGLVRSKKTPKVRTYSSFLSYEEWIPKLVPTQRLMDIIENLSGQLQIQECLGLHIRRGDHQEAILHSPTSLFIDLIQTQGDQNTIFFLSTDDQGVEEALVNQFGPRIRTTSKESFRRDTERGIQQALIDMVLLSRCRKIYGSVGSSFSEIASVMGKKTLEVVSVAE